MPYKYPQKKGWKVPKQPYRINNWSAYNEALRQRGDIEIWLSDEAIAQWYEQERVYDGTGTPNGFHAVLQYLLKPLIEAKQEALREK